METRARYVLIGAFTVAGFLGMLAFLLWFGSAQMNRQFAYYDVLFDSVSGITRSSEVRFAGLTVGQVQSLGLDASGQVRVRLEVQAGTPVRTGSLATLETQGVTGVAVVALSAGRPDEALLRDAVPDAVPVIPAGRSPLQNIAESAPAVLDEALKAIEQVNALLAQENRDRVANIIANLDVASAGLARTLDRADTAMGRVDEAVAALSDLAGVATDLSGQASTVLASADTALRDLSGLRDRAEAALDAGTRALSAAGTSITTGLDPALADVAAGAQALRDATDRLTPGAETMLSTWTGTGTAAAARLDEAARLIASLQGSADAIDPATLDRLGAAIDQVSADLPALTADLRDAGQRAAASFTALSDTLARAQGPLDDFLSGGLPEIGRLASDLRGLVATLDDLAAGLQQGPAGAILDGPVPEFRR